ncbi:MAG: precorrin-3B C(17)-methyltransferase [Clostridia bacterium]|nr:precorrin-3B C(17)-methyltransferase [Clostridia bacterium]
MKKLYVVGIGPGNLEGMTGEAVRTLKSAEVIVGYLVYVDLVRPMFPEKEYIVTPMRQETERCRMAIDSAMSGKVTAVICSGDAGVYGMAGLILTLAENTPELDVIVVPGVTAALSGAALLGAPIGHDFAVISLSDLLTPWEKIERRLELAASADFCIVLYNPASRKRADYLRNACDILLRYASKDTICGVVREIGREGQAVRTMRLCELREYQADMFTTVFIGNSQTSLKSGRMVTPRGYRI